MAVALIIGPFFTGHLRPDDSLTGRARLLSDMRYHTGVIISLFVSLGTLAASSRKLMKLTAYAERIQQLQAVVRDVHSNAGAPPLLNNQPNSLLAPFPLKHQYSPWSCLYEEQAEFHVSAWCPSVAQLLLHSVWGSGGLCFGAGAATGPLSEAAGGRIEASEDEIAFEGAQVVTPGNATLVKDLTIR